MVDWKDQSHFTFDNSNTFRLIQKDGKWETAEMPNDLNDVNW